MKAVARDASQAGTQTTHLVYGPPPDAGDGRLPRWLYDKSRADVAGGRLEIDITDEAPEEFIQAFYKASKKSAGFDKDRARYNAAGIWRDLVNMLDSLGTAPNVYRWAQHEGAWKTALQFIGVMEPETHAPVGWYDLDSGLSHYASLYDVVFVAQPLIFGKKKRKLFLMTEEMWVSGNYPPEVGSRTTSKEKPLVARDAAISRVYRQIAAPQNTPQWLWSGRTRSGNHPTVDVSIDPENEAYVDVGTSFTGVVYGDWSEFIDMLERSPTTALNMYVDARVEVPLGNAGLRSEQQTVRTGLSGIALMHKGSPVGWYDLDRGFVRYATLLDLALHLRAQPLRLSQQEAAELQEERPDEKIEAHRPLWLLSQAQWDEAQYPAPSEGGPPYVEGVSVGKEKNMAADTSSHAPKDYRNLIAQLQAQGWRIEPLKSGHYRAYPPDKTKPIVHFDMGTDPRGMKNTLSRLRRSGFVEAREEARDFTDVDTALASAQSKYSATHYLRDGDTLVIYSPKGDGYEKRDSFKKEGYLHWPARGTTVKLLPSEAQPIRDEVVWDPESMYAAENRRSAKEGSFLEATRRLLKSLADAGWQVQGNVASKGTEKIRLHARFRNALEIETMLPSFDGSHYALGWKTVDVGDLRKLDAASLGAAIQKAFADQHALQMRSMREHPKGADEVRPSGHKFGPPPSKEQIAAAVRAYAKGFVPSGLWPTSAQPKAAGWQEKLRARIEAHAPSGLYVYFGEKPEGEVFTVPPPGHWIGDKWFEPQSFDERREREYRWKGELPKSERKVTRDAGDYVHLTPLEVTNIVLGADNAANEACGCQAPAAAPVKEVQLPWVKISRDPAAYEAAMKQADSLGPIETPQRVYELLAPTLSKEDQEVFGTMSLDVQLRCRGVTEVHRGERDAVRVAMADVLRVPVQLGALAVIVWHNHPSGNAEPSEADKELTESIREACDAAGITFIDHIIVGGKQFYSFAEGRVIEVGA